MFFFQIYESAIRAAARKGYPIPQRSRKADLLEPKKTVHSTKHVLREPRFGLKKSVIFDHY